MKYFFLPLILMAVCFYSHAKVLTCNNKNPSPGQYSTLAAAYAVNVTDGGGDTIYLSASNTGYGTITVAKKITIIGTGFNPTNKQDNATSTLTSVALNNGSDFSSFIGLTITSLIDVLPGNSGTINGLSIIRCEVNNLGAMIYSESSITLNNLTVNGCEDIVGSGMFGTSGFGFNITNSTISNTLLVSTTSGSSLGSNLNTFTNVTISNNDILYDKPFFFGANYISCNIYNNIFYDPLASSLNLAITGTNTGNTASNNVKELSLPINYTDFSAGVTQSNNIIAIGPVFVNTSIANFHLLTGTVAHNEGTDGADAGMYGGALTSSYLDTGEPAIPQIRSISAPATSASGGNVNANVISTIKP